MNLGFYEQVEQKEREITASLVSVKPAVCG
jgi:hypothetical protein